MGETTTAPVELKDRGGKRHLDPELKAMNVIDGQLAALEGAEARTRVLLWVILRHELSNYLLRPCSGGACGPTPEGIENAG